MYKVAFRNMSQLKSYVLFRLIFAVNTAFSDDCRTIEFLPETHGMFLENHMIRSMKVEKMIACESECFQEPNCVSFNYGPINSDTPSCALNNRTHFQASVGDFLMNDIYIYRYMVNPCQSNPCPSGFTCQVGFTYKGYRCICLQGGYGLQCESSSSPTPPPPSTSSFAITPTPDPWITGPSGSKYQRFNDPQTWNSAKSKCIALGAQLVKITSTVQNEFIRTNLLDTSGNSDKVWIGLSDETIENSWVWSDGSPLEPGYDNWGSNNPNNYNDQDCVVILVGTTDHYGFQYNGHWNDLSCYNNLYSYICMK